MYIRSKSLVLHTDTLRIIDLWKSTQPHHLAGVSSETLGQGGKVDCDRISGTALLINRPLMGARDCNLGLDDVEAIAKELPVSDFTVRSLGMLVIISPKQN